MRSLVLLLAFCANCSTAPSSDPIIGCWQRVGDDVALIFEDRGVARWGPREGGVTSYVFPEITWRRTADGYLLRYDWQNDARPDFSERAQLTGGRLIMSDHVEPHDRVRLLNCGDALPLG